MISPIGRNELTEDLEQAELSIINRLNNYLPNTVYHALNACLYAVRSAHSANLNAGNVYNQAHFAADHACYAHRDAAFDAYVALHPNAHPNHENVDEIQNDQARNVARTAYIEKTNYYKQIALSLNSKFPKLSNIPFDISSLDLSNPQDITILLDILEDNNIQMLIPLGNEMYRFNLPNDMAEITGTREEIIQAISEDYLFQNLLLSAIS